MKNFTIPRTMEQGRWAFDADPIQHFPQSKGEVVAGVVLAVVIGIVLAALLVHWSMQ
jgi:ABC-type nitrate/sulfonate/bicarbonate transport system permease component